MASASLSPVGTVQFHQQPVPYYRHQEQTFLAGSDIGRLLGFSRPRQSMGLLWSRNQAELSPHATVITVITVDGKSRKVRLFSETGAYLVTMFAATPTAKEVRLWLAKLPKFVRDITPPVETPALSRRTTAQERNPLAVLVNQYLGKLGPSRSNYTSFWRKTFHPVFGVNSVEELTIDQLPKAVAFMEAMLAASASALPAPTPAPAPAAPKKKMGHLDMFVAGTVSSEFSISKDKFMPEVWEGYSLAERMLKGAKCEGDNARAAREMLQLEGYALESHYSAACMALHAYERALFRVDRLVKVAALL